MKKIASFFKSICVFLLVLILQVAVTLVMDILSVLRYGGGFRDIVDEITATLFGTSSASVSLWLANVIYGILAVILFGYWYRRSFVRPDSAGGKKDRPHRSSFLTVIAILFLGIGMQYVSTLVADVVTRIRPGWAAAYSAAMENAGYGSLTLLLVLYTVALAPVVEELVFRGLILRYADEALPFWIANIWQALLFGVLHGSWMQAIYAFVMGLFLGYVAHTGRGIRHTIPIHIIYNVVGLLCSALIARSTAWNYPVAVGCGLALTILALWIFHINFTPKKKS